MPFQLHTAGWSSVTDEVKIQIQKRKFFLGEQHVKCIQSPKFSAIQSSEGNWETEKDRRRCGRRGAGEAHGSKRACTPRNEERNLATASWSVALFPDKKKKKKVNWICRAALQWTGLFERAECVYFTGERQNWMHPPTTASNIHPSPNASSH